jgi:pimeloyl-ACP methyl ester carboxylesterase
MMSNRSLSVLFLIPMIHFAACSAPAPAPTPNPDIGKFEAAPCPVTLPEGIELGDNVDFGYVTVPERHAHPEGPVIQLAVARFRSPAESPAPDPVILNTGGPGDSNLDQFLPLLAGPAGSALLAQRDAVIVELRGLRYSKPALACPEVFDVQLATVGEDLRGDEVNERLLGGMRACHDRLVAEGVDLSAYNNGETAADIALVLSSLGYDRFNLFGSSAGTMVAQHVMRDFPERVRAVVLNAAVPLGGPWTAEMLPNAAAGLEAAFKECAKDEACAAAYPDLEDRFFALLETLNREPVTLPVTNPVDGETVDLVLNGDRLSTWLFASLYTNTQIPATVGRFLEGHFEEVQQGPQLFFPMTRFTYGLSYSIFGSEAPDFTVEDTLVSGRYAAFVDGCAMFFSPRLQARAREFWRVDPLEPSKREVLHSDIPTLVLNGEMDHVLPPRYVKEAVKRLENGHLFLFPGVAHSPVDHGDCALGMLLQFFADPSKAPDGTCVESFEHVLQTS